MLKSELVARLTEKFPHIAVRTIHESVNYLIQMMSDALGDHQRIEIRGFGSFTVKHRVARQARNPSTGERITTSDKFSPHFKPGKALRDKINAAPLTTAIQVVDEDNT